MKVIIGLGNPGKQYVNTRHNAGSIFIDMLIGKSETPVQIEKKSFATITHITLFSKKILVAKPTTFMNESGKGVKMILSKYGIKDLADVCIAHDDLDLVLGNYKIQKGKGPKIHNGIKSVEEAIGKDFWRIRIGIDGRSNDSHIMGESYVLQEWDIHEKKIIFNCIENISRSDQLKSFV
ncbi:aminoacyl-tRNA hydrolase [Candidatus Roizmanbacteria bacterium CG10_big_fil_rev_8_21_14_0_10_39_6]|uniref:Peptidyl-tRNA hydrolase n=1 Tax=Candidatus Roizmanbacteria bacterium CG10_big_fil_rev_8_21_14_0_10_39_6 TaxID=1974853 RepID=A0A2M8KSN4_9BACT|nr:MAG: aminoacyl-tRNA hydrolase [Candidatus Roizmanbacteria bacterium CG10_big_fil_rev_8_21_14_0_10_39_6]